MKYVVLIMIIQNSHDPMCVIGMQKSIGKDIMLLWGCNCSINWIARHMEPDSTKKQEDA